MSDSKNGTSALNLQIVVSVVYLAFIFMNYIINNLSQTLHSFIYIYIYHCYIYLRFSICRQFRICMCYQHLLFIFEQYIMWWKYPTPISNGFDHTYFIDSAYIVSDFRSVSNYKIRNIVVIHIWKSPFRKWSTLLS